MPLPKQVLDLLTGLVDKSLVVEVQEETARYRLLQTLRQYSQERLAETPDAIGTRDRHRDYFLALAETVEPQLQGGPQQAQVLARLEAEHDNLRAAISWCRTAEGAEAGLRLTGALWRFWHIQGHLGEGCTSLAEALAHAGAEGHTQARAEALTGAGVLANIQGDHAAAQALAEESLAIKRELGEEAFAIAWQEGRAMTMEQAIAFALENGEA